MTRLFNRSEETAKRRKLRRNLAPAEALLWTQLQGRKVLGYKFRRQYGVGVFVIDFYCPALKLAIEVDGDSHCGEAAGLRDAQRQAWIEGLGIRFIRFVDTDVLGSTDAVVEQLCQVVLELSGRDSGSATE